MSRCSFKLSYCSEEVGEAEFCEKHNSWNKPENQWKLTMLELGQIARTEPVEKEPERPLPTNVFEYQEVMGQRFKRTKFAMEKGWTREVAFQHWLSEEKTKRLMDK